MALPGRQAASGRGDADPGRSRAAGRNRGNEQEVDPILKTRPRRAAAADRLLSVIAQSLEDDLAEDVRVISLVGKADYADHMIVASGMSARRVTAMAEHLVERLKAAGVRNIRVEGLPNSSWVLIDAGDVVIHLFRPEARAYYDLEKLWEAELRPAAQAGVAGMPA